MKSFRCVSGVALTLLALSMSAACASPAHHVKPQRDAFALPLAQYLIAKYNGGAHPGLSFIENKTRFRTSELLLHLNAAGMPAEKKSRAHRVYARSRNSTLFDEIFTDRLTGKKGVLIDLGPVKSRRARSVVASFRVLYGTRGGYGGQCFVQNVKGNWIVTNERITVQY